MATIATTAEQMLTVNQVAERLGVGRDAVYDKVTRGEILVHNVGTQKRPRLRVAERDLAAYQETVKLGRPGRSRRAA